jgi:hypothetical protein
VNISYTKGDNMEEQNNVQFKIINSDASPEPIYTNGLSIKMGLYDTTIQFLRDVTELNSTEIQQVIVSEIKMSPQLAKVLAKYLEENVKQYEDKFGKIPDKK